MDTEDNINVSTENDSTTTPTPPLQDSPVSSHDLETNAQRMERCFFFKTEGNALFRAGDTAGALDRYRQGLELALHKHPCLDSREKRRRRRRRMGEGGGADDQQQNVVIEEVRENGEGEVMEKKGDAHGEAALKNEKGEEGEVDKEQEQIQEEEDAYTLTAQLYANAAACIMHLDCPSLEEAVGMLSEAIRHKPDYHKAWLRRAECYFRLEKYPSALVDYEQYEKAGGELSKVEKQHRDFSRRKQEEEMKEMLGNLKDIGNKCLGYFGLSTDNFKFDKDPATGSYSMRFER